MTTIGRRAIVAAALAVAAQAAALASEPPDAEVNPVTTSIESVDAITDSNGNVQIRHSVDPGQGAPRVEIQLTVGSDPDRSPRIAILDDGTPAVAWWREGAAANTVFVRKRTGASGGWGAETPINASGSSARNPEIVSDGSRFWVVYEVSGSGGTTDLRVRAIQDVPEPWPATIATSSYSGDLDSLIHFSAGDLWITWIDSGTEVGWSEYDPTEDLWSTPSYESYAADSVEDARERIRATVTGN